MTTATKPRIKRDRCDAGAAAVDSHQRLLGAGPPMVPDYIGMGPGEKPFYDAIIRARALDEWGRVELALAAQLAWVQATIEERKALIRSRDKKKLESSGFPSMRAVSQDIHALVATQTALLRNLRIGGNVAGDPLDELPRRKAEREAEQTIKNLRRKDQEHHGADEPALLATQ